MKMSEEKAKIDFGGNEESGSAISSAK